MLLPFPPTACSGNEHRDLEQSALAAGGAGVFCKAFLGQLLAQQSC